MGYLKIIIKVNYKHVFFFTYLYSRKRQLFRNLLSIWNMNIIFLTKQLKIGRFNRSESAQRSQRTSSIDIHRQMVQRLTFLCKFHAC